VQRQGDMATPTSDSAATPHAIPGGLDALRLRSFSHRTTALADLERIALTPSGCVAFQRELGARGIEAVLLSTCNRTELYWHSHGESDDRAVADALARLAEPGPPLPPAAHRDARGTAAAAHLFRVTAGLESLVVGESEIVGQVREAIENAEEAGDAGFFLPFLFRAALRFGGLARAETRIGVGALSVASAAVQRLARALPDLNEATVVVIGAGTTGLKAARHLVAERVGRVVLLNRTVEKSREAAAGLGIAAGSLEDLPARLAEADGVIAAAQVASPLVTPAMLAAASRTRRAPLVLLDLSLPRAIAPECANVPGVVLHDLSGFEEVVGSNRAGREREIPRVEELLARELKVFEARAHESRVRPLVAELRLRAEAIRRDEVARALARTGGADAEALDRVTRRIVDRLLHVPSRALRRGDLALDAQHAGYLRALFGLEGERESGDPDGDD